MLNTNVVPFQIQEDEEVVGTRAKLLLVTILEAFRGRPFNGEGFVLGSLSLRVKVKTPFQFEDLANLCRDGYLIQKPGGTHQITEKGRLWLERNAHKDLFVEFRSKLPLPQGVSCLR